MCRHQGTLPTEYIARLEKMSLDEIAVEAARFRSDHRPCGTSTALILRWIRQNFPADVVKDFMANYREAWRIEKSARAEGCSSRPADRPVKGGRFRYRRNSRDRAGFVLSY
jgi:hypothetical protein